MLQCASDPVETLHILSRKVKPVLALERKELTNWSPVLTLLVTQNGGIVSDFRLQFVSHLHILTSIA